ncbi:MAG TPA: thioredoxin family protein [Hyphomicrobium sp.]|nr:thioredoxin family protein [Hyphomicrobium sp.]
MTMMPILKSVAAVLAATVMFAHSAMALEKKTYDAAAFKAAQDAGQSILVDVHAPWCPTCQAQRKVLDGLKDNAAYKDITIFEVDYDTQTDALKAFGVRQQSTLIAFKGAQETGRSVGATKPAAIEDLLKTSTK